MKDWTGNAKSIFTCNGASNHTEEERQPEDYYATEPKAVEILLENEAFKNDVWEPACGGGHISEVLKKHGYNVLSTDIINRGYPETVIDDFFTISKDDNFLSPDIITNPPYKYAKEFVEHALEISKDGTKIAMFLKLTFLEGKARKKMFEANPPRVVYISSSRLQCAKNGDFEKYGKGVGTAVAYGWYVWEKGFKGDPIIKWVN